MARILVAYGTTEGQTAKVADYISRDHVYEWDSVKQFTEDFLERVVQQDAGTSQS